MSETSFGHDPLTTVERWIKNGRNVAIATVMETWGSAPRPVGSQLAIDGDGNFEGSVSGGCVEGMVIAEAIDVIADGNSKMLQFGVADETAWRVGLSCGGRIRVYVQRLGPMDVVGLARLNSYRRSRATVVFLTDLANGAARVITEDNIPDGALGEAVALGLRSGRSEIVGAEGAQYFLNVLVPPPRIVIIGAVHISQALAPMARLAGFDVTIIDPRTAFATPERFVDTDLIADWPGDVLVERPLDAFTALVAVTHDPKIDDFSIAEAIRAGCFYIGALGSRKTHSSRIERLKTEDFSDAELAGIHGPIGLNIGASGPGQIAVAILAQIIESLGSHDVLSLKGNTR